MIKTTTLALCSQDGELLSGGFTTPVTVTPVPYSGRGCIIDFGTTGPYYNFTEVFFINRGSGFRVGDRANFAEFSAVVGSIVPGSDGAVQTLINISGTILATGITATNLTTYGSLYENLGSNFLQFSNPQARDLTISIYGDGPFYKLTATLVNGSAGFANDQILYFSNAGTSPTSVVTTTIEVENVNSVGTVLSIYQPDITRTDSITGSIRLENILPAGTRQISVTAKNKQYEVALSTGSGLYYTDQLLRVPGNLLNGISPDNDLIIPITQAGLGTVTKVSSIRGTPFTTEFYDVPIRNIFQKVGTGALMYFDTAPTSGLSTQYPGVINFNWNRLTRAVIPGISDQDPSTQIRDGYGSFTDKTINTLFNWPVIRGGSGYSLGNILEIPAGTIDDTGKRLPSPIFVVIGGVDVNGEIIAIRSVVGMSAITGDFNNYYKFTNVRPKIYRNHLNLLSDSNVSTLISNVETYNYKNFTPDTATLSLNSFGDMLYISGDRLGGRSPDNDLICISGDGPVFGFSKLPNVNLPVESGINSVAQRFAYGQFPTSNSVNGQGLVVDVFASKITNNYGVRIAEGFGSAFSLEVLTYAGISGGFSTFEATIERGGQGYRLGDVLTILGGDIGGIDGENDLTYTLTNLNVDSGSTPPGAVYGTIAFQGTLPTDIPLSGGTGRGVCVKINNTGGSDCQLNFNTGTIVAAGSGYSIGNIIRGGSSAPTFSCEVFNTDQSGGVTEVGNFRNLSTSSAIGETVTASFPYSVWTNQNLIGGSGLIVNISASGVATVVNGGKGYFLNETVVVFGSDLGAGASNVLYTVSDVGGINGTTVVALILQGTYGNTVSYTEKTAYSTNASGCKINLAYTSGWIFTIIDGGIGYVIGDILTVSQVPGLQFRVTSVTGGIIDELSLETPPLPNTNPAWTPTVVSLNSNYGKNIKAGDIFTIDGSVLGGDDGINNLEFTVVPSTGYLYESNGSQRGIVGLFALQSYGSASTAIPPGVYSAVYRGSQVGSTTQVTNIRLSVYVCANQFSLSKSGIRYTVGDRLSIPSGLVGNNDPINFRVVGVSVASGELYPTTDYTTGFEYGLTCFFSETSKQVGELLYKNAVSLVQINNSTSFNYNPFRFFNPISNGSGSKCSIYISDSNVTTVMNKGSNYDLSTILTIRAEDFLNNDTVKFNAQIITPGTLPNNLMVLSPGDPNRTGQVNTVSLASGALTSIATKLFFPFTNLSASGNKLSLNSGSGYEVGDLITVENLFGAGTSQENALKTSVKTVKKGVISTINNVTGTPYVNNTVFRNITPTMLPRSACTLSATIYIGGNSSDQNSPHYYLNNPSVYTAINIVDGGDRYKPNSSFLVRLKGGNRATFLNTLNSTYNYITSGLFIGLPDIILVATTDSYGSVIQVVVASPTTTPSSAIQTTRFSRPYFDDGPIVDLYQPTRLGNTIAIQGVGSAVPLTMTSVNPITIEPGQDPSIKQFDSGSGVKFKVSNDAGGYFNEITIVEKGTGYSAGDMLTFFPIKTPTSYDSDGKIIPSRFDTTVDGATKLTFNVKTVDATGGITAVNNIQGIGWPNQENYLVTNYFKQEPGIRGDITGSYRSDSVYIGSDCLVDVAFSNGPTVTIVNGGTGYEVGDLLTIEGEWFGYNNSDGLYDIKFRVAAITNGQVVSLTLPTGVPAPDNIFLNTSPPTGYITSGNTQLDLELVGSYPDPVVYNIPGSPNTGYKINDVITIPATKPNGQSQWGGTSPGNDLTIVVQDLADTLSNFTSLGTPIGLPYSNYSEVKFKMPINIKNVVYMEWITNSKIAKPCLVRIDELMDRGFTNGKIGYWRYVIPEETNDAPDRMTIKLLYPKTYDTLTVRLLDITGAPIKQTKNWMLELVIYSQV
jgi:hypothetical protein